MSESHESISKFLSLVLRHSPETIGLQLHEGGWASIDALIRLATAHGRPLSRQLVEQVVRESEKQRFALSDDGLSIRANQGHSVKVELGLVKVVPPDELFHGTATRFLDSIRSNGLWRGSRHHVHLSETRDTASDVGKRHGKPVVLSVRAGAMHEFGYSFFRSENGVWLTESVPFEFLAFPSDV
ncbi:RNA 2'-phosphotransferase [Rhizobacter sp. LjRoot28]|uniref:RNA 2'-phosphotransferase n=1 Tax=Rhizobacter sp. LjRoot28 TaxID=3342309 RepID=UPI003ECD0E5B